jgi:Spy/CpxP family protein refolding chaperone
MTPKLKLMVGLIAIFAAGLVVGGSVGFTVGKSKVPAPTQQVQRSDRLGPGNRDRDKERLSFTDRMCSRLKTDLNLTDEQLAQIKPIVEQTSAQVKALNEENFGRVRDIFRASHEKMKAFLTPEQIQKLEEKNREREAKWKKDGKC